MNTSTTKNQNSPSLTDSVEAIYSTLEQATSILDLLAAKYIKTPDYPIFMTIEDELLGKAKQQLNDLIGELPSQGEKTDIQQLKKQARDFALMVHGEMFKAEALAKSISAWFDSELVGGAAVLDMNKSDVVILSDMVVTLSQALGKQADDYAFIGKWKVQA